MKLHLPRMQLSHTLHTSVQDMIASFVVAFFIFCGAVALAAYVPQWAALLVTSDPFFRGIIQRVVTASGAAAVSR